MAGQIDAFSTFLDTIDSGGGRQSPSAPYRTTAGPEPRGDELIALFASAAVRPSTEDVRALAGMAPLEFARQVDSLVTEGLVVVAERDGVETLRLTPSGRARWSDLRGAPPARSRRAR